MTNKPVSKNKFTSQLTNMLEQKRNDIADALADQIDVGRFTKTALVAARKSPRLRKCSIESVYESLLDSARLGLQPDGKEGAIVPYYDSDDERYQAQFQPMAEGISSLMLRSNDVAKVEARAVRENDEFDYSYGTGQYIEHKPARKDRGGVIASYAIIYWTSTDEPTIEVLEKTDIEDIRNASDAPNSPAWSDWYGEMARKSAVKRISKYADLSPEAREVIDVDNEAMQYDFDDGHNQSNDVDEMNDFLEGETEDEGPDDNGQPEDTEAHDPEEAQSLA